MKRLILAEKLGVAGDLSKVLGANQKYKNYYERLKVIVTWAPGRSSGLKAPEDLNKGWQSWQMDTLPVTPKKLGIKPLPRAGYRSKAIKQLVRRGDVLEAITTTDTGREGELVAHWTLEYVYFNRPVERSWILSQTDKAIETGFKQLKLVKEYDALYESTLAQTKTGWLVGLNVTGALTVKYADDLSAGHVQTLTLALVRDREEKTEQLRPQTYLATTLYAGKEQTKMVRKNQSALRTQGEAQKLVQLISTGKRTVTEAQEKLEAEPMPLPCDLTEIQRETNQRYGYSAKKILSFVQGLYETHKIATYPRTDSKYLINDMKSTMNERLQAVSDFASEAKQYPRNGAIVQQVKAFRDSRVTDHHALLSTENRTRYERLSNGEQRICQMIVSRLLGLFAQPHEVGQTKVTVKLGKE